MKPFFLSHFCGAGGSSLGAIAAGCDTLGIEIDPKIAELYRTNVGNVVVQDITTVDPLKLDVPSVSDRRSTNQLLILQTSPPCQDWSQANTRGDKNSVRANILRETYSHYKILQPEVVILENVQEYAHSPVFAEFKAFLESLGYRILVFILNFADVGVPQSRCRVIMIGVAPELLLPTIIKTHSKSSAGQLSLFGEAPKLPWVGWYETIRHLWEDLPLSHLTKRQLKAIESRGLRFQPPGCLIWTKYLGRNGRLSVDTHEPAPTVTAIGATYQPILVASDNSQSTAAGYKVRMEDEPSFTLRCHSSPKAILIERIGDYSGPKIRMQDEPSFTLRSHLGDDGKGKNDRNAGNRSKVIDVVRVFQELEADVRSLTTLPLALLQTFPKNYQWSGKSAVDIRAIGNSVPPLGMEHIIKSILEANR